MTKTRSVSSVVDPQFLHKANETFRLFARRVSLIVGSPWAAAVAVFLLIAWLVVGPVFDYSDGWQLFINTTTTVITIIMVFIIQNSHNRESREIHLKLDELIRSVNTARNKIINSEDLSDEDLDKLRENLRTLCERYGGSVVFKVPEQPRILQAKRAQKR